MANQMLLESHKPAMKTAATHHFLGVADSQQLVHTFPEYYAELPVKAQKVHA